MEQTVRWESLIKDRMRPCIRLAEEDPSKRNRKNRGKRRDRKAYRAEYRKTHIEELTEKRKAYNASEHGKKVNSEYNAMWREKNKEYDKKRKAEWWRKKHPNPRPTGRPRKNEQLPTTP